jgi:hypothetical protein
VVKLDPKEFHIFGRRFSPGNLDLDDEQCDILLELKKSADREPCDPVYLTLDEIERGDERIWKIGVLAYRGLIDLCMVHERRAYQACIRYGALAYMATHDIRPVPKTGDPAICQPHRPRAINLED